MLGIGAVFVSVSVAPHRAGAQQTECLRCEYDIVWEDLEPTEMHRFDSNGETFRECEGASLDESPDVTFAAFSAPSRVDSHEGCHNDWVENSSCWDEHGDCGGGGMKLSHLQGEVDRLLSIIAVGAQSEDEDAVRQLENRIAGASALTVHLARRTIDLRNCDGDLITEWDLPLALLEPDGEADLR